MFGVLLRLLSVFPVYLFRSEAGLTLQVQEKGAIKAKLLLQLSGLIQVCLVILA